jgi:hypothetical protein
MKVIKRGVPPSEVPWHGTCAICHSVVEADRSEVSVYGGPDPKNEGPFATAACPVCGNNMHLYPKTTATGG